MLVTMMTFAVCFAGAVFPAISAELCLVGAAALVTPALVPVIVLAGTAGQLAGKVLVYLAARGLVAGLPVPVRAGRIARHAVRERIRPLLQRPMVQRLRASLCEGTRSGNIILCVSALVGVPPLYAVSVASGALGLDLRRFILVIAAGRMLRHGVVAAMPALIRVLA